MADHWHILGAGSIGCLWAAHLVKAGHKVTMILRNSHRLDEFEKAGSVRLETNDTTEDYAVEACLADRCENISRLLVTTKAYDTASAIQPLKDKCRSNASIVILQNGMGAQQQAADLMAPINVWAASTTDGAWLRSPFHVVYAGHGETKVGALSKGDLPNLPAGMTPAAPLKLVADPSIELSLWRKLAINCAINPLTAFYDCRNGALAEDPEKHQHMARLCDEIEQLCHHKHLKLFDRPILQQAEIVAKATGSNFSSMLQDVRHQRKTELDFITGYLLKQAQIAGIELPANEQLYNDLKEKSE